MCAYDSTKNNMMQSVSKLSLMRDVNEAAEFEVMACN